MLKLAVALLALLPAVSAHCDDDQFCPGELGSEVMPDAELGRYKWHDSRKWGGVIDLRFPVPCNGNITGVSFQARGSDNDLTWDNERPLWFFVARGQSPDDQCAFDEVVAVKTIKNNEGGKIRQVAFSTPMEVQEGDRWGFFWKWGVVAFDWNPMTGDGTDRTFIEDDKNYCGVVGKAKYKPVVGEPAEGYFTQDQSNKDSVSHRNYAFWVKYSCPCPEETTAQPPVPTTEEECVDGETKITKGPDVQPGVGKYLKHDTYFKKALISLRYPMPCNGVITRVKYQARGSSNDRSWNDDRKFSLTIFRGQDPNNPCTFSNFVGMRLLTNNVAGIVEQDLEMQNKTIRVEKDDHWGLYWADRKQGGGVVAFDWAESVGDKPNRVFLEENQNYCAHSMRQRVKIKDEPAVFDLTPHTDKDSPTYRNYAFWYTVACDCEEEEDNP